MRRLLILVSALLVAAPLAAAQPQRHPKPPFQDGPQVEGWAEGEARFHRRGLLGVTRYLDLSEDQVELLTVMFQENREKALPLFQGIRAQRDRVRVLADSPSPDPTEIGNLVLSIQSDREELARIHSERIDGFKAMLNPDQLSRYEELLAAAPHRRARAAFGTLRLLPGPEGFRPAGGNPARFRGARNGP